MSAFNKSLSPKMRHTRHSQRTKSRTPSTGEGPTPKRQCFRTSLTFEARNTGTSISEDDIERHVSELREEWAKAKPDPFHIKSLLKSTREDRVAFMSKTPSGSIAPLLDRYPCFADSLMLLMRTLRKDYVQGVRGVTADGFQEEWRPLLSQGLFNGLGSPPNFCFGGILLVKIYKGI
ncbi:hypothetical protein ScPMuIL_001601 [Solemya velum]